MKRLVGMAVTRHNNHPGKSQRQRKVKEHSRIVTLGGVGLKATISRARWSLWTLILLMSAGERLIAERPLCIWPQNLSQEQAAHLLAGLDDSARNAYLALSRSDEANHKTDQVRAIRATNGFAVQLPSPDDQAPGKTAPMVFPQIARINHSWYATFTRDNHDELAS